MSPAVRVYEHEGLYRIALSGKVTTSHYERFSVLRATYRTVQGGEDVDLLAVVRMPPVGNTAPPLELATRVRPTADGTLPGKALAELAALEWRVARYGSRLVRTEVGLPVAVWTYPDSVALAACLKTGPKRPLGHWLRSWRKGGGPDAGSLLRLPAEPLEILRPNGTPRSLSQKPRGDPRNIPAATLLPFRGKQAETAEATTPTGGEPDARRPGALNPGLRARCEGMDFGELRRFLDSSLDGLLEGTSGGTPKGGPRSEEEFDVLLVMLREKAKVRPALPPLRPDPGPHPGRRFRPSKSLLEATGERDRLRDALRKAEGDPGGEPRVARSLRRGLDVADRHARTLEARERERLAAAVRSYELAKADHEADRRRGMLAMREHEERLRTRARIAENLEGRIGRAFGPGGMMSPGLLTWELLPPGKRTREEILAYYERLGRGRPDERYEPERVRRAFSLGPEAWYVGSNEFDGYIVFTFARTDKVLLECPKVGNAIYVLGADWKRLSRLSKGDLLAGSHVVARVEHRGDWFWKVQRALGPR